ncbi:MAG: hypothetical protein ACXWTN_03095 [Methylosarcina sp.]
MNKNPHIPFQLTEQSLSAWLRELSSEQCHASCRQLLSVLQAFKTTDLTQQQLLIFLPKIGSKLDIVVDQLERKYLDAGFPLATEEQTIADLVTLVSATLADHYLFLGRKLLENPSLFDRKEKATVLYLALNALGKSMLNRSIVYCPLPEGFWLNCYQIYKWAENAQLLDLAIASEKEKTNTINAAFKRILLFELANPGQFRPRELKAIYKSLDNCSTSSPIEADNDQQSLQPQCIFNLSWDQRPRTLFSPPQPKDVDVGTRYFSPWMAAKNLHQLLQQQFSSQNAIKSITHSSFTRAIKSLSLKQRRKHNRKAERLNKTCIVGFNHIVSYLFKMNQVDPEGFIKKTKKDTRIAGNWEVPDLDLVPLDDESTYHIDALFKKTITDNSKIINFLKANREFSSGNKVWNPVEIENNKRADTVLTGEFEIIDSSAQGFQILWKSPDMKVKVGEILAFPTTKGDRVEIGLIRRIGVSAQKGLYVGVEIIGFESEAIGMVRPDQTNHLYSAIFLPGITALKQQDSIIYNSCDFSAGEFVVLHRGKINISCRLKKLINSTSAITQMELYYTSLPL